jgi:hypothetical protein
MSDEIIPLDQIQSSILVARGLRVILDSELARLYAAPTKRLNEQVRRNPKRFPADFCFQLTAEEVASLRSQIATSKIVGRGGRRYLPFVFTEHGAIQAANVLNSAAAVEMSVHVVRAFVRLRELLGTHKALASKLAELEQRFGAHDEQIGAIIKAIRLLTTPPGPGHDRKIGFHPGNR